MNALHEEFKNRSKVFLVPIAYAFFAVLLYYQVFIKDIPPLIWDQAIHFMDSVKYYHALRELSFSSLIFIDRYYPPFPQLLAVPGYIIFAESPEVGIFTVNLIAVGLISYSIHKISKILGKKLSFLAVFVLLTSPIVLDQSTVFMVDLTLTAMIAITWYFLLNAEGFTSRRYSILSGITAGLGLLCKWTLPFFVVVPVLYGLIKGVKTNCAYKKVLKCETLNNFALFILVAFVISAWWYLPNLKVLILALSHNSRVSGTLEGDPEVFSLQSILYYMWVFVNYYFGLLGFVVLVIVLLCAYKQKTQKDLTNLLLFQLVFAYVLFTLTRNKAPRFLMPLLPFLTLLISHGVESLLRQNKKVLGVSILVILGISGILNTLTFLGVLQPASIAQSHLIAINGGNLYFTGVYESRAFGHSEWSAYLKTTEEEWKISDILSTIGCSSSQKRLYVLANNPWITWPLRYRALLRGCNIEVIEPVEENYLLSITSDYVLYTEGGFLAEPWAINYTLKARKVFTHYTNYSGDFIKIREFQFPDSKGVLYKRRSNYTVLLSNLSAGMIEKRCSTSNPIFGQKIELIGLCIYQTRHDEHTLLIEYYWRTNSPVKKDYEIFVHFTNENGDIIFQQDHQPCGGECPTSKWKIGEIIHEVYIIKIPSPGTYQIRLGFWYPSTGERLPVDSTHNDGHNRALIGMYKFPFLKITSQ